MTSYVIKGTTSDVTNCDLCGRVHLKKTVALAPLDADGNQLEVIYAGTGCAGKAMGRTGSQVALDAKYADMRREIERDDAASKIRLYTPLLAMTVRERADRFFTINPHLRTANLSATAEVTRILAEARAVLGLAA